MLRSLALLLAALLLVVAAPAAAQRTLPARAVASIDSLFAPFDRRDAPGYVVGVIRDGRLVYSRAFGMAELDHGVPLSSRSVFHLASVSKQFTGTAVALLVRDGKLSMDDPVARFVPAAAKYGDSLRVKHLVYMTSGVHEYTDIPRRTGLPWQSFHYFTTDEAIEAALRPDTLRFAPGTNWQYTNSNYMLLTRVVEAVAGKPFSAFMEERIFAPVGMRHSHVNDDATLLVPGRVTSYIARSDGLAREAAGMGIRVRGGAGWVRIVRNSPHYGGSGVFASLEDLARWDDNFYTERVGGPGFTALMQRRMRFSHPKENDAVGLVRGERFGREIFDYAGGDLDTSTYMARFPAERLSIVVLSNMPTGNAEGLGRQMLDRLHAAGVL